MEEILERKTMDGSVPERMVHERMSQGKGVKGFKEEKKVPRWSIEEMKEKPNIAVEEDTEEMTKWRGLSQSEMDQCWQNLAERMEEDVLDKYKVEEGKREASRGRGVPWKWRSVRKNKKYRVRKLGEDFWARIISLFREYNLQRTRRSQRK